MIQFRFNPHKSMQAIRWMLAEAKATLDFHTILKSAYFADKEMIRLHSRPVFGATYRAMNFGPVPLEIYEMLKCEPYWLSELQMDDYPWERTGYRVGLRLVGNSQSDLDHIAPREIELIRGAFDKSRAMTFSERTRETHGLDWVEGVKRANGRMAYEDMISPDHPHRDELIEDLLTMAPRLVL